MPETKCVHKTKKYYTTEQVEKKIGNEGYALHPSSPPYQNFMTPLIMVCPKGHKTDEINLAQWSKGKRCPVCQKRPTTEYIDYWMSVRGFRLLSPYINSRTPLKFECPEGHLNYKEWNKIYRSRVTPCTECYRVHAQWASKKNGPRNFTVRQNRQHRKLTDLGYTIVTPYTKYKEKMRLICPNGHEPFDISMDRFDQGYDCPVCSKVADSILK